MKNILNSIKEDWEIWICGILVLIGIVYLGIYGTEEDFVPLILTTSIQTIILLLFILF